MLTVVSDPVSDTRLDLSVVLIVLNGAPWIGQQLEALARQVGAGGAWEVVVADNGSTDGTQDIVLSRSTTFPVPLRLADASGRPGVSHARNIGASAARGTSLAFCDCDDIVADGWVASAVAALREGPCVVGFNRELTSPQNPDAKLLNPGGLVGRGVQGCNFGVRREVYFSVGGFDESLPPYGCDDSEFSLRLLSHGHVISPAPGMDLYFRQTVGLRRTLRKVYLSGIAETVVWSRHPDAFASPLRLSTVVLEFVLWPVWAFRHARVRGLSRRALARSAVTAAAHVTGYWTWIRGRRAGPALLVFDPYDVS